MNKVSSANDSASFAKVTDFRNIAIFLAIIIALAGVGGSYYFYKKYSALKANPNMEAQKKTDQLMASLGKIMDLPVGEAPTVATILDKSKLSGQAFFNGAENGDVLFAYTKSLKAVLYRPSTNKIINVAPISSNQPASVPTTPPPTTTPTAFIPAPLRIAYYNGTRTVGLSGVVEKEVKSQYPDYETAGLANAASKDYKESLVVDISGKHAKEASELAALLNGKMGIMPKGEATPDADVLIISGK